MKGGIRPTRRKAADEAGFTLVELLVALALFSLIMMLLFDNVRFGVQAWHHGSAHAEHVQQDLVAQDLLRRMIGNLYPMLVSDSGMEPRLDFEGSKEAIRFLADAPLVANGGGRFRFKIFVERQQDRADLVMNATPELANAEDSAMTRRTVLLPDIDSTAFSYLDGAAGAPWQDDWTQRGELPRLIRIRVAFRAGEGRQWPELLIAPHIAADVSCSYDPTTQRCRGR